MAYATCRHPAQHFVTRVHLTCNQLAVPPKCYTLWCSHQEGGCEESFGLKKGCDCSLQSLKGMTLSAHSVTGERAGIFRKAAHMPKWNVLSSAASHHQALSGTIDSRNTVTTKQFHCHPLLLGLSGVSKIQWVGLTPMQVTP